MNTIEKTKTNSAIYDSATFTMENFAEFQEFILKREQGSKWFSDTEDANAPNIKFHSLEEPLIASEKITKLISDGTTDSSVDAFLDTLYYPCGGYVGTSQIMEIGEKFYPVGESALRGLINRAGLTQEGFEKLRTQSPESLSSVLNILFSYTQKYVTVLVQDEKVRAVNSDRYAVCPMSFIIETLKNWIQEEKPDAKFVSGFYCHDFCELRISFEKYRDEIFKNVPTLKSTSLNPGIVIRLSHTGKSAVSIKTALIKDELFIPTGSSVNIVHVASGGFDERLEKIKKNTLEAFAAIFVTLQRSVEEIEELRNIEVVNAYNAILRAMKSLNIPKKQGMEAATIFFDFFGNRSATAYHCYLTMVDAYAFIVRDNPNDEMKKFVAADIIAKAAKIIPWKRYGDIPGDFSW